MNRPARIQVRSSAKDTVGACQGGTYNIWYGRWTGEGRRRQQLEAADTRCNIERDQGYTKAIKGSVFCIYFARGCCIRGAECQFWHRIPTPGDKTEQTTDVFGRERFRDEREDMGGIGSFEKCNKTLYVGNIGSGGTRIMDLLKKHFGEWGEIEHINILPHKSVAFVSYYSRSNAEFAKEAMYGQSLGGREVLNIRWATEDPNPRAVQEKELNAEKLISDSVVENLTVIGERGNILDYNTYYQSDLTHMQSGYMPQYNQDTMNRYYMEWAARDPDGYAEWYAANLSYMQQYNTTSSYYIQQQASNPAQPSPQDTRNESSSAGPPECNQGHEQAEGEVQ